MILGCINLTTPTNGLYMWKVLTFSLNYPFHFHLDIRESTRAFKTTIKVHLAENLNYGTERRLS